MKMRTEQELVNAYRILNPSSRVISIIKYVRNGSTVRQLGCILCHEESPTWDGRWPRTQVVNDWIDKHKASHGIPQNPQPDKPRMDKWAHAKDTNFVGEIQDVIEMSTDLTSNIDTMLNELL
jgi:hypothetical protein